MKQKKIVFVEAWYNPLYVNLLNAMAKSHPELHVFFITDADALTPERKKTFSSRITVIGLPNIKLVRKIFHPVSYLGSFFSSTMKKKYEDSLYMHTFKGLSETLSRIKPDVLVSDILYMPYTWQTWFFAKKHKTPFILRTEIHKAEIFFERLALRITLFFAKNMLSHTSLILPWTSRSESFVLAHFSFPSANVHVLPAGIITKQFTPKKQYSSQGSLRLLSIQRFVPYKDHRTLIHGFSKAIKNGLDANLTLLGTGILLDEIKQLAFHLGVSERVSFIEQVPYKDIPAFMAKHDVLILSSKYEAIGMVVPEAMACGLPVIVSDTAGAVTYVTMETGWIFKTGHDDDLATTLQSLAHDSITKKGKSAARHIQNHYDVSLLANDFSSLLKKF